MQQTTVAATAGLGGMFVGAEKGKGNTIPSKKGARIPHSCV